MDALIIEAMNNTTNANLRSSPIAWQFKWTAPGRVSRDALVLLVFPGQTTTSVLLLIHSQLAT